MPKAITKVKIKEEGVEIRYAEKIGDKTEKEVIFKCTELQHPDFDLAISALVRDVYDILDLPLDWAPQRMKITGVSFSESEKTNVEGAVISGLVELDTCYSPFCFNTPHLPFAQYSPTGESPIMPDKAIRNLVMVKEQAEKYLEGRRAQLELIPNA